MTILASILWVIIGAIYVIYKCLNEKPKSAATILIAICIFLCVVIIPNSIINYIKSNIGYLDAFTSFCLDMVPLILTVVVIVIIITYMIKRETRKQSPEMKSKRKLELHKSFKQAGYPVSITMINKLIEDPTSPINNSDKLSVPLYECYEWLCIRREFELQAKNKVEFDKILGLPLESIPLNTKKELGEAVLQRKALAIKYIMEKDGLKLPDSYCNYYWVKDSSDYPKRFIQYINEHR